MQLNFGEFYESLNDALTATVAALGGFKKIGAQLWGELPPEQAAQRLRDCLNPSRREKLSPEQLLFIVRMARQAGFHALMNFVAADTGYKAAPIDAERQKQDLQAAIAAGMEQLNRQMARLERMQDKDA
ncbi:MAG: hypothetical protein J0H69_19605 [Burkholderiales bacterium]|nr:hypothetical protein [Burkholderiales bacterium]